HDAADDEGKRQVAPEALAHALDVDVEHHHHEEEEHHHRADVDHHEHDGEELGAEKEPQRRRGEERQHEEQHPVHRVARGDDQQPGHEQYGAESVEHYGFKHFLFFRLAIAGVG